MANYAGETYDAVILYAYVAQYMIEHGLDPRDGRLFRQVAHNIHFYGKSLTIECRAIESGNLINGTRLVTKAWTK